MKAFNQLCARAELQHPCAHLLRRVPKVGLGASSSAHAGEAMLVMGFRLRFVGAVLETVEHTVEFGARERLGEQWKLVLLNIGPKFRVLDVA